LIDFLPMARRLIRREGIVLNSIAYWSDVLRSMVGDSQPTIVRYDPRDLSRIYWLAPDGEYYDLTYADVRRPPVSLWEHRAARQQLRAGGRRQVDEHAIFRAIEAMRQLATDATTETKQRRRWRERTRQFQVTRVASSASTGCLPNTTEIPAEDAPLFEVEEWS
jgi:putative transposase